MKRRDGFQGEKQINVPQAVLNKYIKNNTFLMNLFITHIGYFPKALYHYRERKNGCEDYILLYCLGGKGYIEHQYEKLELKRNQFIIIPPHEFHRFQSDINDPWSIYWVHFSSNKLNALSIDFKVEQFYKPTDLHFNEIIIDTWNEMYASLSTDYTSASIGYANLCLYRFLSFFLFPNTKFSIKAKEEEGPVEKSITFLKENIDKRLSIEEIACRFQCSSSLFYALFKQKTGMSPIDYFIKLKIRYACQLLTKSNMSMKEIAQQIGYDDPYYFSRLFKQTIGRSPKEYRCVVNKRALSPQDPLINH